MTRRNITVAEESIKKRLFAEILLDTENRMSRDEIIRHLDITEYTYSKWASDPSMVEWTGIEPWRYAEKRKQYTRVHKLSALRTLTDVMMNSHSDVARVKAAEIMLAQDDSETDVTNVNAQEIQDLLTRHAPNFIIGTVNVNQGPQEQEVEADYRVIETA